MVFHENRLLADDSQEISFLIFVISQKLSSAAVVIGVLSVNMLHLCHDSLRKHNIHVYIYMDRLPFTEHCV